MIAVIEIGNIQFLLKEGEKIKIGKIEKKEGQEIVFDKVLLLEKQGKIEIGKPYLEGKKVIGKILRQGLDEKKIIFKYKPKKRYKRKKGHRQPFSEIEIVKIS